MSRYLTRGMVVVADDHPGAKCALSTAQEYAPRTVAVAHAGHPEVPDVHMVHPRKGVSIDAAFAYAGQEQIPWIAMRRDFAEPASLLGQVLEATGRRTRKDLPGFAILLVGAEARPVRRILTVIDRADGQPSGLLVLAAVAAAQATDADLDVLLMGAAGEAVGTPKGVHEAVHVTRDKDLYEQGVRRAEESGIRANWIAAEDVLDKRALVLEQIAEGDYDLVIDDLGSISLGGRLGRSGRIRRSVAADGPAEIVRAILEETDVPLALVLDGVRLGLIPPVVVKGGAGAVLAIGLIASGAPAASASPSELAQQQTTVSQDAHAYTTALDLAAALASPADVEAALAATADVTPAAASAVDDVPVHESASDAAAEEETLTDSDEEAGPDADVAPGPGEVAPADFAPEDVVPEAAPEVDAGDVEVDAEVDAGDVAAAEDAAHASADELKDADKAFDKAQEAAIEATDDLHAAAAEAEAAAEEGAAAVQAYDDATTQAVDVVADATGVTGALPGGASQEELAAAEAAQAQALAEVGAVGQTADEALVEYLEAAEQAAAAEVELEAAAAAVTEADAVHQEAAATADATEAAYEEAMANARVSPVAQGNYHESAHYGDSGEHWSQGYHTGDDYAAPAGTTVMAAGSGTVVEVGYDDAYGNRIVIEHDDGYYTTYNHLSQSDVEVGQEVTAGDAIGEVGDTGNSFGAHLHFEVTHGGDGWSGGDFVDPDAWLNGDVG